mmetsp:Transcript_987/g.1563  ORF Transcript_987/g.1563 Transcript_987/m.1563 type:complete len:232 (-) Transcript_987:3002-3697(-)
MIATSSPTSEFAAPTRRTTSFLSVMSHSIVFTPSVLLNVRLHFAPLSVSPSPSTLNRISPFPTDSASTPTCADTEEHDPSSWKCKFLWTGFTLMHFSISTEEKKSCSALPSGVRSTFQLPSWLSSERSKRLTSFPLHINDSTSNIHVACDDLLTNCNVSSPFKSIVILFARSESLKESLATRPEVLSRTSHSRPSACAALLPNATMAEVQESSVNLSFASPLTPKPFSFLG